MRRIIILCSICFLLSLNAFAARPKLMSIQVRKGQLRSSPSFLGSITATVEYGDQLQVVETKGTWTKLTSANGKNSGWIHTSALTKKRIKLKAGEEDAKVAASSGELALAGKGFNSDVEAEFKTRNKDIDFSWIDKMEKIKISVKKIQEFLTEGKIESPKGGTQ
ncbi:SH3 domain-containing protein [Verrucomicrobiota bacterium]